MKFFRLGVLLAVTAIVVAFFVFFRSSLAKPFLGLRSFFENRINKGVTYEVARDLEIENLKLKSEIFDLKSRGSPGSDGKYAYLEAGVYSYFPFNNRGIVAINKGLADGINMGMPVLTPERFVFGRVKSVKRTRSEVITVFDPLWKSTVFLGSASRKAVVLGGTSPFVDLIPKDMEVASGMAVLNGSDDLPYGMPLGFLGEPALDSGTGLLRADLRLPYSFEGLEKVLIITDFP